MQKTIILYHANCTDGAGSMWSAWKFFKDDAEYIAVGKQSKKQSSLIKKCLKADTVFMCDMMLEMVDIETLARQGVTVNLLDHHVTNIDQLKTYTFSDTAKKNINDFCDIERSGAGITWDHFHGGSRPVVIDYIEDFDLWHWKLPDGPSIHTFFSQFNWTSNEFIIETFNEIEPLSPGHLAAKGTPLVDYRNSLIAKNMSQVGRALVFGKYNVPILNGNHFISETGNEMAPAEPFAIIWQVMKDGAIRVSLRSDKDGMNVGELAGKLGNKGGGHAKAAGTTFDSFAEMTKQIEIL